MLSMLKEENIMKTTKEIIINHVGWISLIVGAIGLHLSNYYEIMFARIFWIIGFAFIVVRLFSWVKTWKIRKRNIHSKKLKLKTNS